jgi:monoamine oxidase
MDQVDVAVVGGGCAGAYTAWRMQTGTPGGPPKVVLFEASERIGGRLESLVPPGAPDLRAEFGGMGFTNAHQIVNALVTDVFSLPTAPFPSSGPAYTYLRGTQLLGSQATDPALLPYKLAPSEQGKGFAELMADAVGTLIPGCTDLTEAQWFDVFAKLRVDGLYLDRIGFWNFLAQVLTPEGYAFARDSMGHDFPVENWNAADTLMWFFADFAPGTTYLTLQGGYETLPATLADAYTAAGGEIAFDQSLAAIGTSGSGFVLEFESGYTVQAGTVVLAMPRRALEIVAPTSVVLSEPNVQQLLQSVSPVPVMKLFLAYDSPWWTANGNAPVMGHSVTDLPLRTIYYFGTEGGTGNTNSLLMASYTDASQLTYWEGLRHGDPYVDLPNPYVPPNPPSPAWTQQCATAAMVTEAQRQLAIVHAPLDVPMPYSSAFKDWGDDPYGGAMHTWNVAVFSPEVMPAVLWPDPGRRLFICGEAYSRKQGWVEGALDTAEQMLEGCLGYPRPPWLVNWQPPLAPSSPGSGPR